MEYILNEIRSNYKMRCMAQSDINEHLPTLFKYACECDSVFETGVRGCVSSWALLYGLILNPKKVPKKLLMNDINECNVNGLVGLATNMPNIDVKCIWKNNLDIELPHMVDLTFIDTWHVYAQLKRELEKFAPLTKKYIIMHDTEIDGIQGETIRNGWDSKQQSIDSGFPESEIRRGLLPAIDEFLKSNPEWELKEKYLNNNGLTILSRKTFLE